MIIREPKKHPVRSRFPNFFLLVAQVQHGNCFDCTFEKGAKRLAGWNVSRITWHGNEVARPLVAVLNIRIRPHAILGHDSHRHLPLRESRSSRIIAFVLQAQQPPNEDPG